MKMLDAVMSRMGWQRSVRGVGPGILASMAAGQGGSPRPSVHNMGEFLARYADQAWVFACIRIIQTKGAGVALKIYKQTGPDMKELPDHPLKALLDAVNPFMNGYDLREATHGFVELTGNAYWLLDNFINGKPTEIYPLNPAKVKIRADKEKYITGYAYEITPGVAAQTFKPEEILHFKTWNPLDEFYGLAPISAAREASDSMMHADRYNRMFFENSAEPGGLLTTDDTISDDATRTRITEAWKSMHQGTRKAHKIAILEGGLKWQSLSATHQDMQFPDLKRMTREDILAVYSIPPVMVGVFDEANYSNAQEQRRIFWIDSMIPRLRKLESVINERLVKGYDPGVVAAFDLSDIEALQKDEKFRAEADQILVNAGILLINEARKSRKLDPVPWGDTWNAPIGLMPIEAPARTEPKPTPAPTAPPADGEPQDEPPADEPVPGKAAHVVDKGAIRREVLWQTFKGVTEAWERRWKAAMARLFTGQERQVLSNLRDNWEGPARQARLDGLKTLKSAIDAVLFDGSEARRLFRREGRSLLQFVLQQSGEEEARRYDLGRFTITEPRIQKWLDDKAFKFADEVNSATEDYLREQLKQAVQAGESIADVSRRVEDVFDMARGYRSERIARTEVVSSSNRGAMAAYEESGVVQKTEWITARDNDVRDTHKIDGQERNLGEPFKLADDAGTIKFPGDPDAPAGEVINCRCTVAPIVERGG